MKMELRKLLLCLLLIAGSVKAATRTVTSLADSGAGSLRATIAASANGDAIVFAVSGTIPATNGELVVLRAVAGPRVVVQVLGDGISFHTLKALLPVYEEGAVEPELVREGARNLQDYFQGRGFFEVQVKESREEDPQRPDRKSVV